MVGHLPGRWDLSKEFCGSMSSGGGLGSAVCGVSRQQPRRLQRRLGDVRPDRGDLDWRPG